MKKFLIPGIILFVIILFFPKTFVSSPGYESLGSNRDFTNVDKCIGFNTAPTNLDEMLKHFKPGKSLCFGIVLKAKEQEKPKEINTEVVKEISDPRIDKYGNWIPLVVYDSCRVKVNVNKNEQIAFPLTISGSIDSSDDCFDQGWSVFEGEAGSAYLADESGNNISNVVNLKVTNFTLPQTEPWKFVSREPININFVPHSGQIYLVLRDNQQAEAPEGSQPVVYKIPVTLPPNLINKCNNLSQPFVEVTNPIGGESYKPGDTLTIKWLKCNSDYRHVVAINGFEMLDDGREGPKTGAIYLGCYNNMNGQASWIIPEKINKGDISCGNVIEKDFDFNSKRYNFFITIASSQEDGVTDKTETPFTIGTK